MASITVTSGAYPIAAPAASPTRPPVTAYAELRRMVVAAGLLERAYGYYFGVGLRTYALFALGLGLAWALPPTLVGTSVASLVLGFALVQLGLLGHDAGHMGVFRSARWNWVLGEICWSLTLGVGFWNWRDRHNAHHAHTNETAGDPEIRGMALVAFTEEDAQSRQGWQRRAVGYQGTLAPILLLLTSLAALVLRVDGWLYAVRRVRGTRRWVEVGLLALNLAAWAFVILQLGGHWLAVFIGSQLVAGLYLSLVAAPNHKGMPVWTRGVQLSFIERQVLSSRNLLPHPVTDFVYGGLNYQIEHHLFPTLPRVHLGRARAIIQPFCEAHGLAYEEVSPLASYQAVYAELHRVARSVREE